MRNKWLSLIPLFVVIALSYYLFRGSLTQSQYQGLPTVPCLDYTKQIVQDYSLTLSISINGKPYPVSASLGHDNGNCLHDIYANDSTGRIYVKTNEPENFDLGNLFDVWHSTLSDNQIFSNLATNGHTLKFFLNGQKVKSGRETPLFPNTIIGIVYK